MKLYGLCSLSVLAISAFVGMVTARADPRGLWLAQDGAKVRVSSCGKALCGTLVSTKSLVDPATGKPWTDKNNLDPGKRDRPLVGLEVFISMVPDGRGKWSGQLYSTEHGQILLGHLLEVDRKAIRIEGCVGNFCGGQNMRRIQ